MNMTKQELFDNAEYYKDLINRNRTIEQQIEIDNYVRNNFIYSSNVMEGNALTLAKTKTLLERGTTSEEKNLKECYEAAGLAQAYDYMLSMTKTEQFDVTVDVIKRLHYLFYQKINPEEAGQYRKTQEYISDLEFLPPKAEDVEHLMEHFINQMQTSKRFMHPIEFAAMCHKRLTDIHPFKDGTGRIAILLMNLILVNAGYVIFSIPPQLYKEYINALKMTQRKNNLEIDVFIKFIAHCVIEAEKEYCKILNIFV